MSGKNQNSRILFGLKVRHLRQKKQLSFAELSKESGMSVSYLNEIEKGKKFPKQEKLKALAASLGVAPDYLTSPDLPGGLAPVGELLKSNFLNELPLELFGIELGKVVEIVASAPKRVGAFISTLVELSRNYALREENFYFGALRSYLEMHYNYFPEIEEAVDRFKTQHQINPNQAVEVDQLRSLLEHSYGYQVRENGLERYPDLQNLRAVFLPETKQLLLNSELNDRQKAFQFGKELGFQSLELEQRAVTSSLLQVASFEEVLSHAKATYFSAALLIDRDRFVQDIRSFFDQPTWDAESLMDILEKYQASPEMFFQRLTNVLPAFLGIQKIFFLRFAHGTQEEVFKIDKELHLDGKHHPQSNGLYEHYCRRWLSLSLLKDLRQMQEQGKYVGTIVGAQRSKYIGSDDEYLVITIARPAYPTPDKNVSGTFGIKITDSVRKVIRFLDDPALQRRAVNKTCERCAVQDCAERSAPPRVLDNRQRKARFDDALTQLLDQQAIKEEA